MFQVVASLVGVVDARLLSDAGQSMRWGVTILLVYVSGVEGVVGEEGLARETSWWVQISASHPSLLPLTTRKELLWKLST